MSSFSVLSLPQEQLENLEALGYQSMTPVQMAALPPGLAGRDLVVQAQTGSGKTVAFGLPVIFGPKYKNFNEAKSLINRKGALSIKNYQGLISAINTFKKFDSSIAHNYIKENCVGQQNILCIIDQ